ncbi:iron-sulfur cluster repair di-iron protein [Anaerocolumna aminovalerica]|uniref:iron-sulfur cluster repair di-iron protein n=1 Tax=Anaerocolumna aminovalerica TaxID=1527 RepID=UPI000BE2D15C|nr:iron-sulfur cluster repair di-iron protein [Anaerocolumna aminovalerica]
MNIKYRNNTIGAVVAELPKATEIFKEYGIDYCCGGHRLLADVLKEQNIYEDEVYDKLQQAEEERRNLYSGEGNNFKEMSPEVLSAYIEDTHHSYLRKALPEIAELLSIVLRAHGKNHKELFDVYRLFGQLKADLEQHLLKEETLVFPIVGEADENLKEIKDLTHEIITEHEAAGEVLRELRSITKDYQLPEDACKTFEKAYEKLEELEQDLHQHIHLENNILLIQYSDR